LYTAKKIIPIAAVIPRALFQLKLKPYFPIMVYLYQGTKNTQSSGKGLFFDVKLF